MRLPALLALAFACTLSPRDVGSQPADPAAVLATVRAFHDALQRGDSAAAMALLAPDVRILESGGLETREEYRSGHLPGDIAFARAVPGTRSEPIVTVVGDVAWVVGTSRTTGTYRDRQINSAGAELMVLSRTPEGWRIRAIHWSSRAIRTP
jgi:ketosteroid isomerase-like protein